MGIACWFGRGRIMSGLAEIGAEFANKRCCSLTSGARENACRHPWHQARAAWPGAAAQTRKVSGAIFGQAKRQLSRDFKYIAQALLKFSFLSSSPLTPATQCGLCGVISGCEFSDPRVPTLGCHAPPRRKHPVRATFRRRFRREMLCSLIGELMGKLHGGDGSVRPRAAQALVFD
jgi:hypothetical protein